MRRTSKLLIATMTCTLPLLAVAAGTARADTTTPITQLTNYQQMVVDTSASAGSGLIFMSGGTSIVVTDLGGTFVTTLDEGDGVQGIALSADGTTLYAALTQGTNANSIGAITVSTVTATTPTQAFYPLGTGDVPFGVAVQSGKVWVSYSNAGTSGTTGTIGDIDLTTTGNPFETQAATDTWTTPPDLAADPSDTGVLLAVWRGDTTTGAAQAATFSTTADPATPLAPQALLGGSGTPTQCMFEHQIAVIPGGAQFIAACGSPQNEYLYSTALNADLATPLGDYNTGTSFPGGVAVDASGLVAVGTYGVPSQIYVYKSDGTLLNILSADVDSFGELVATNGLAWEDTPAGPELAAMIQGSGFALQVYDQPTVTRSTLTLAAPSEAVIGKPITLTGSLTLSNGAKLPSAASVTVTRTGPGGPKTLPPATPGTNGSFTLTDTPAATGAYTYTASYAGDAQTTSATTDATVTVNLNTAAVGIGGPGSVFVAKSVTLKGTLAFGASTSVPVGTKLTVTRTVTGSKASKVFTVATGAGGAFKLTDAPTAAGRYTYTARYAGNPTTDPATGTHVLSVVRIPSTLTVTTNGTNFRYEPTVRVTAHLGPTFQSRTVSIYAQWFGSRSKTLLKTGRVNSSGNLTITYRAPHSTTFSVVFNGDARYAPRTVTRSVGVAAAVSESISGYYTSENIGGVLYRLFHSSALMHVAAGVAPNKRGECVQFEVQEFFSGAWNPNVSSPCVSLSKASQAFATFALTQADLGFPYRIRADFIRNTSDQTNQSADSPWLHLLVES